MKNRGKLKPDWNNKYKLPILILFTFMGLTITACHLDREGLGHPINRWDVTQYFCPGDSVTVSWNLQPGFDSRNCNQSCRSLSDCPTGSVSCVDGRCINQLAAGSPTPPPGQCPPITELTISTSEGGEVVSHTHDPDGSRTFTPSGSVTFTASGGYQQPLSFYAPEDKTSTLVTPDTDAIRLSFPFACPAGWSSYDIERDGPTVSENVAISSVTNISGRIIELSGPNHSGPPVRLGNGESTDAFNGKLFGGWRAEIPAELRVSLPTPRCGPTALENAYPDLAVDVQLTCSVEN